MFSKKYVFETQNTKSKRVARNFLIFTSGLFLSVFFLCIFIPQFAQNHAELTSKALFKKSPDVIAVFTGDRGRINYAFKMAEKYPSAKVFITGVFAKNSLKTLLKEQGRQISIDDFLEEEGHHIELDYLARNTVENGLATVNYLEKLKKVKSVLIISSDYHILRISLIMKTLLSDGQAIKLYFDSIETNYKSFRNLKILLKEVYKLFKTSTFLLFWDREMPS